VKKLDHSTKVILLTLGITVSVVPIYASDYTVESSSTTQNDGNLLDGDDSLAITSEGSISTAANSDDAVNMTGDNITIINQGVISTSGSSSDIINGNNNTTVTNSGTMSTTGSSAKGIVLDDYAVISNSGIIKTLSSNADAILIGENGVVNNSGNITTSGSGSEGISAEKNSKIYNSGTIKTASEAIHVRGDYGTIVNSGIIITSGTNSDGMDLDDFNTVINSGTISTTDDDSDAIYARSDNEIINSGKITTSGDDSNGIRLLGDNNSITNTGSIIAKGINSYGIGSDDVGTMIINNNGYIEATNTGSFAIYNDDAVVTNTTLNLNNGSRVLGAIDLGNNGGDTDTVNIYGGSPSAAITIENAEEINLFTSGVKVGNTVTTVDSTSEKSNSTGLATLTSSIHNSINQRRFFTTPSKLTAGFSYQERQSQTWVSTFAGIRKFAATNENTKYDYRQYGVSAGNEWDYKDAIVGITAGVANSKSESDLQSFENTSSHVFAGVYGVFNLGRAKLSTTILTGYGDNENKRYVYDNTNGLETATSDTQIIFLSPSVNLQATYRFSDGYEFRPSANLTYNIARVDGYKELGTTQSNFSIDDRYVKVFSSKLQVALAERFDSEEELEIRAGINARYSNDDNVDAVLNGTSFDYSIEGDNSVYGFYTGVNFKIAKTNNLEFIADVEIGASEHDEKYANASLKFEYIF